jgi:hypothetical protein
MSSAKVSRYKAVRSKSYSANSKKRIGLIFHFSGDISRVRWPCPAAHPAPRCAPVD